MENTALSKNSGYFDENNIADPQKLTDISTILTQMISAEVVLTIKSAVEKGEEIEQAES